MAPLTSVLTPMQQLGDSIVPVATLQESENGMFLSSVLSSHRLAAVNTFIDGSPTWTDARGHSRQIDYMAIPSVLVPTVKEFPVDHDIILSPVVRADHELLRVSLPISRLRRDAVDDSVTCSSRHTKISSPTPPRWVLDDPVNISRFQWLLKDCVFDPLGNIDLEVSRVTSTVQTAQRYAFPVPPVRPRKH